jgi:hypothetical protein
LQAVLLAAAESTRAFEMSDAVLSWTEVNSRKRGETAEWDELTRLVSQWRGRPVFISLEGLIRYDPVRMSQALAEALPEAHILVTTRAPDTYLRSAYSHAIVTGSGIDAARYARKFGGKSFPSTHNIVAIKEAYGKAFAPDAVHFLPFELLRDDQSAFLDRISALFGMNLAEHTGAVASGRKISPPDSYLALLLRSNMHLAAVDPEWTESAEWRTLLRISADAVASAKGVWPHLEFRARELNLTYEPPRISEEMRQTLKVMQAPLRELPLYKPYLAEYGLAE